MADNQHRSAADNTDEEAAALVQECAGFDYVRFVHCSVVGEAYCKLVPARHLRRFLKAGCRMWEGTNLGEGFGLSKDQAGLLYGLARFW